MTEQQQPKRVVTNGGVQAAVVAYLIDNPNRMVLRARIAQSTGYPERAVSEVMSRCVQGRVRLNGKVEPMAHGSWVFRTSATQPLPMEAETQVGHMFEQVGHAADGRPLLRSENGSIWRAERV